MVIWLIGLSGSGKTTIGNALYQKIKSQIPHVVFIDGDVVRSMIGQDLGHSIEDRRKNADRICHMCQWLDDQGIHVVCAILSIFHESQEWNRQNYKHYFEVFIDTPLGIVIQRDHKGLYQKALKGNMSNIVGVDIEFLAPLKPDLVIHNDQGLDRIEHFSDDIFNRIKKNIVE